MEDITREQLSAYLEDALSDVETARIEKALRDSAKVRELLQQVRLEQDRGEHSLGAIWRRERLSCLSREQLNQYLHELLEPNLQKYVDFHLQTIGCPYCQANLDDLREKQAETPQAKKRHKKIFDSSAGILEQVKE